MRVREIPLIPAETQLIPSTLGERFARTTGLGNRLLHGYPDVDHQILFSVLREDLADLEAFAVAAGRLTEDG